MHNVICANLDLTRNILFLRKLTHEFFSDLSNILAITRMWMLCAKFFSLRFVCWVEYSTLFNFF